MGRKTKIPVRLFAAVRDGDMSKAEAARQADVTQQGFLSAFRTFLVSQIRERSTKALRDCAKWLHYCLSIGFNKSEIEKLETLWWRWHDENGNVLKSPRVDG